MMPRTMPSAREVTLKDVAPEGGDWTFEKGRLVRLWATCPTLEEAKRERNAALRNFLNNAASGTRKQDTPLLLRLGEAEQEVKEIENDLAVLEELEM